MKCQFTKPNGEQCDANAMIDSQFCFSHNPETAEDKKSAVLKGGLAPKPRKEAEPLEPIKMRSADDILALIEDTVNRIRTEPITRQKANSIGYLINIALKALEVWKAEAKPEAIKDGDRAMAFATILGEIDPEVRENFIKRWRERHPNSGDKIVDPKL